MFWPRGQGGTHCLMCKNLGFSSCILKCVCGFLHSGLCLRSVLWPFRDPLWGPVAGHLGECSLALEAACWAEVGVCCCWSPLGQGPQQCTPPSDLQVPDLLSHPHRGRARLSWAAPACQHTWCLPSSFHPYSSHIGSDVTWHCFFFDNIRYLFVKLQKSHILIRPIFLLFILLISLHLYHLIFWRMCVYVCVWFILLLLF